MERILIIDDDTYICKLLDNYLNKNGYHADSVYSGSSAIAEIKQQDYDLILCDFRLPDRDGFDILRQAKSKDPALPVVIMTAYKDLATAVRLIKAGAYDYITKPLIPEEVLGLIREAIDSRTRQDTVFSIEKDFITGKSKKFRNILEHIRIVSPVDMTVVIEGETGSGKEYVARAIHSNSNRKKGPFIAVDCGALPKGLVNSELFGHLKGSFTGATYDKKGLFEQASGGTLFLDEISNLDAENQMKLLRVLQEKTITRIGDTRAIKVDVRLVVASNEDLMGEVQKNNIREDLYHRLNEFRIVVPPLREREEDVLVFADAFIERASRRFSKHVTGYEKEVKQILLNYQWPGNIRELKNVITRSVLLAGGPVLSLRDIPDEIKTREALFLQSREALSAVLPDLKLKDAAGMAEKEAIIQALIKSNYNKSKAARLLKIDRKTLYNKIKQFNISLLES
ncbi:MAG TPA: sigma-54-dependent Fis family transcriptional regulator [Bacteroides sp.]|nr:sigma-54-dependent Fis family transcriptional regulator [Bacteroides sp.]